MKYDIYFAAPFFNDAERMFNECLLSAFEKAELRVFYPPRDGLIAKDSLDENISWKDISETTWACDTDAIKNSIILVSVLDGRTIDEGVCVEIGFAAALLKNIIAFTSDDRKQFPWGHNPMIIGPIHKFTSSIEECVLEAGLLIKYVDDISEA